LSDRDTLKPLPSVAAAELWRVNRYLWFSLLFAGVWLWQVSRSYPTGQQISIAVVFCLAVASVSLRSWMGLRSGRGTTGQIGWVFTAIDIGLIAAVVRLTGGYNSELWLFYFLVVVSETLSVSVKAELALQVMVLAGLAAAVWPTDNLHGFFVRVFSLITTSGIARRLFGNAEARSRALSHLREQLSVEREKTRVAREIHDGVGREIVNATLSLEIALRTMEVSQEDAREIIVESLATLRSAMEDTRALVFETRSYTEWSEPDAGLCVRAEHYARRFADRTGLNVTCQCRIDDVSLTESAVFGVLRVMQESLNNIAKHAHASNVSIELGRSEGRLVLTVTDDGDGFDATTAQRVDAGIGLSAMRERAEGLGGTLTLQSEPGTGTSVTLSVPDA